MYYVGNYEKEMIAGGNTNEYDYICTPEGLTAIAVKTNGTRSFYYVQTDQLGSVRVVTNASKAIQTRYYYDAYGKQTLVSGTSVTNRGYTGEEHLNDFGLINLNARLYDPTLGRFLAMDPYVTMPDYTQGYNRYSYAMNNPLRYTDPSGENPFLLVGLFFLAKWYYDGYQANNHQWNPIKWDWRIATYDAGYSSNGNTFFGGVGWGSSYVPIMGYGNGSFAMGYSQNGSTSFYYPGYNYNAPEEAAARAYEESRQNISPWGVGWEWLTGTGPRDRTFYDGDYFTELLKQHSHIEDTRNMMRNDFRNGDFSPKSYNYNLSGWQGVGKYLKDYSTLVTGGLTGNLAVTYLGSYDLSYEVLSRKENSAEVKFRVYNPSTFASAVRLPKYGYEDWYNNSVGVFLNSLFLYGPMSKTTQTFIWTEKIYW